jgi:hypothetical protein
MKLFHANIQMNYSVSYVFNPGEKRLFFSSHYLLWCLSTSLRKLITTKKLGSHHGRDYNFKSCQRALYRKFSVRSLLCSLFSWRCRIAFARLLLIISPCKIDSKESENSPHEKKFWSAKLHLHSTCWQCILISGKKNVFYHMTCVSLI